MEFKLSPIEKIHEAYSAIADGRVTLNETKSEAEVESSDHSKKYLVTWKDDIYSSNDNASYWQGYMGYPILAVLMLQGKLPFNEEVANHFKGINWKKLNTEHKNKFSDAVKQILDEFEEKGIDCTPINAEINHVYEKIKTLKIKGKRSSLRPPK